MPDDHDHDEHDTRRRYAFGRGEHRPLKLTIAAALVGLQGLGALVWGVFWMIQGIVGTPTDEQVSVMGALFIGVLGALLIRFGVGLWKVDAWPRVPSIVFSLICVPISYQLAFKAQLEWVGVPLLACSIAVLVLLFSEDVREAYGRDV